MKLANGLKIAAEIPIGLLVAFLLLMGIGEVVGGDFSGIGHLLPAAALGLLMWLAWKRPLYPGMILVLLGIVNAVLYGSAMNRSQDWYIPILIMSVPLLLAGSFLLLAAWRVHKVSV
jgi:hypothetical protein